MSDAAVSRDAMGRRVFKLNRKPFKSDDCIITECPRADAILSHYGIRAARRRKDQVTRKQKRLAGFASLFSGIWWDGCYRVTTGKPRQSLIHLFHDQNMPPKLPLLALCYFGSRVDYAHKTAGLSESRSNHYFRRAAIPADIVPQVGDEVYVIAPAANTEFLHYGQIAPDSEGRPRRCWLSVQCFMPSHDELAGFLGLPGSRWMDYRDSLLCSKILFNRADRSVMVLKIPSTKIFSSFEKSIDFSTSKAMDGRREANSRQTLAM